MNHPPRDGALAALLEGSGVHLFDGAMGTLLYDRGIFVNVCYDELNLSQPATIEEVHRAYLEAGAELLETNTFGANPVKLSGFGLEARTEAINEAAVRCARRAIGPTREALVLGAIGPLGIRIEPWGSTATDEARGFFGRQVDGLVAGGVDGFILETFQDPSELHQALLAIRERSELPVIAQMTIEEGGRTAYGTDVEQLVRLLEEWGADAIGLNCSVGPVVMLEAIERMAALTRLPLSAQPNAGLPRTVGDRKMYLAGPEYMARYARRLAEAGARFVGGCCGTTPEHVRRMAEALHDLRGRREATPLRPPPPTTTPRRPAPPALREPVPLGERSTLGHRLAEGSFVTSLELVPPRGWDPTELLEGARRARIAGVDLVTLPDAPRGLPRMASIPAALLVARESGLEVLPHYACRDRNMLGMISDLMGAAAAGLRNLLVVTGDLSPAGPYPDHTAVFDIDSIGLTNVLHHLNRGVDPGGHPVDPPTAFVIGVAVNPGAVDLERELARYRWKAEAGAEFVLTQPVFDPETLEHFLEHREGGALPVIAGLWPLDSLRTAEFLDNEVPGIRIPSELLDRIRTAEAGGAEAARREGVRIALEIAERIVPRVQGVHVSSARGRLDDALEVLRAIRKKAPR